MKLLLIFLVGLCGGAQSARILAVVPAVSYSHQVFFRPLWKGLAEKGHEVVLLTTDPMKDPTLKNIREIDLSSAYKIWSEQIKIMAQITNKLKVMSFITEMMDKIMVDELSNPEVRQLIQDKNEHFDLVIGEVFGPLMMAIKHRYNCPFIGVMPLDASNHLHNVMGNPAHSILYPTFFLPFDENMPFFDRVASLLLNTYIDFYFGYYTNSRQEELIADFFGPGYPSIEELWEQVDMLFINANPISSAIRPLAPATISIGGGLLDSPSKPLPENIKNFLDTSKNGAIYFSLGSNVKSKDLASQTIQTLMETFKQLPYKILWKFENDTLDSKPDNVMIQKWLPQQDVLRHKNVKLFITQGGIQSLEEAMYASKPVVVLPFIGDQEFNAKRVVTKGLGLQLDHRTLSVDKLRETILKVINNPKYQKSMAKLLALTKDEPMKPLERAIWWTEYVLRHGSGQHLKGPRIPFYQYYYLDVIPFLLSVLVVGLVIIVLIFKFLFCFIKFLLRKFKSKQD